MKKRIVGVLAALVLAVPGAALANPPEGDPTGGNGSNGEAGCQGINEARNHTPGEADAGLDLVENILGGGEDGCDNGDEDDE